MAVLQLKSTNPKLSYIIVKNPETGIIARNLRLGKLFGYFSDNDQTYTVYFKDSPNEISFKSHPDQSFEYLDTSRYGSPHFILNAISEFFSSLMKGSIEDDTSGFQHECFINLYKVHNTKYIELFNKYLPDFAIEAEPVAIGSYKLTIKTDKTLRDLINFTALFTVFNLLKNPDDYLECNIDQVTKYIKCLSVIDAPYFIKYVFKVNLLRSPKAYKKFKDTLEASDHQKIDMVFGSTSEQRLNYFKENICFGYHVCEIGCGTGQQTTTFAKKTQTNGKQVFAIDTNRECRTELATRIERKGFTNITILDSFADFMQASKPEGRFEYILSEVIEHMEVEEASILTKNIIKYAVNHDVCSLTITTPNADFNQYYAIDGFRHDDHKFEFTKKEFEEWVHKTVKEADIHSSALQTYSFFGIGDTIDENPTTLGVKIIFNGGSDT